MSEPTQIYAGDTWSWTRTESEYPAGTWTMRYHLRNPTSAIDITAGADGETHSVSVAAATTAVYQPGRYDWVARVSDGTSVHTVGTGSIEILPDFAASGAQDNRSIARIVLDMIDAYLADPTNLAASSYSLGGRSLSRWSRTDLLVEREKWKAEAVRQDRAARIAAGLGVGKIQVRF